MELRTILATRLRELMAQRIDLDTQSKVSARAGISQSTVQRILREQVDTNLDVITALAKTFRVSPQFLLQPYDEGEQAAPLSFDEQALLCDWRKLGIATQAQVLGFISVCLSNQAQVSYKSVTELNVNGTRQAPAAAIPAVRRASAKGADRPALMSPEIEDHADHKRAQGAGPEHKRRAS